MLKWIVYVKDWITVVTKFATNFSIKEILHFTDSMYSSISYDAQSNSNCIPKEQFLTQT
jgi:hypothetical protein